MYPVYDTTFEANVIYPLIYNIFEKKKVIVFKPIAELFISISNNNNL